MYVGIVYCILYYFFLPPPVGYNAGGFLKLDSSELKPIATATTLAPVRPSAGFSSFGNSTGASRLEENDGGSDPVNHGENHGNLFLQFLNRTRYAPRVKVM